MHRECEATSSTDTHSVCVRARARACVCERERERARERETDRQPDRERQRGKALERQRGANYTTRETPRPYERGSSLQRVPVVVKLVLSRPEHAGVARVARRRQELRVDFRVVLVLHLCAFVGQRLFLAAPSHADVDPVADAPAGRAGHRADARRGLALPWVGVGVSVWGVAGELHATQASRARLRARLRAFATRAR